MGYFCRAALARMGGDEFAILLEGILDNQIAIATAEQIKHLLSLPFHLDEQEICISASIGITFSVVGYEKQQDCLRDAEIAMYRAKANDGASYQIFNPHMHQQIIQRLHLENDLRRTLNSKETDEVYPIVPPLPPSFPPPLSKTGARSTDLLVYYQPIVCLSSKKLKGFEALVRWQHPHRGMISPSEFIPVVEQTKLILPLGLWVLREACRQMRTWQLAYPNLDLTMSVNISGKQFMQPDLIAKIDKILAETELESKYLKLEITESTMMASEATAVEILKQLQQRQIKLCLDDFGTGYSSLARLHNLPVDTLKIDQSFIKEIDLKSNSWKMVALILGLARNLDMEAIAEGVETPAQLAKLEDLQCQYGQGYLFSRPLDSSKAENLIISDFRL